MASARLSLTALGLFLAAAAAAGCDTAGPGGANAPVEIAIAGTVLDGDGMARPGAALRFTSIGLDCELANADAQPVLSHPAEIRTDTAGAFSASLIVAGDNRGNPLDCLRADVRLPGHHHLGVGVLLPDSGVVAPIRVRLVTVDLELKLPPRPPLAEPEVTTSLIPFGTDSAEVRAALTNPGTAPIRYFYQGPCPLHVRVYEGAHAAGSPTWHDQLWVPCKAIAHEQVLAPGEVHTVSYTIRGAEVLGDRGPFDARPLPLTGEFAVEAVFRIRQPARDVVLLAGVVRFE